jgi:hypothetical protein
MTKRLKITQAAGSHSSLFLIGLCFLPPLECGYVEADLFDAKNVIAAGILMHDRLLSYAGGARIMTMVPTLSPRATNWYCWGPRGEQLSAL